MWYLYMLDPKGEYSWPKLSWRRAAAAGGPSEPLLQPCTGYPACARYPSRRCVVGIVDGKRLAWYELDAARGSKGRELAATTVSSQEAGFGWDLSPDGATVALAVTTERETGIHLISLTGKASREITVSRWKLPARGTLYWAPDAKGLYTSGVSPGGVDLLYIDLQGHSFVLRHQSGEFQSWAIPSPDGRRLAFAEWSSVSNAWSVAISE